MEVHILTFLQGLINLQDYGEYWDAGEGGAGAFIGTTKTRGGKLGPKYTCTYRLKR